MMAIYEVAYNLHIPVYQLMAEMPYDELLCWFEFFNKRPVGWREDVRFYKILQAIGIKEPIEKVFTSFAQMKDVDNEIRQDGFTPAGAFLGSKLFQQFAQAKGGDDMGGIFVKSENKD